jgi:hypothetical protein
MKLSTFGPWRKSCQHRSPANLEEPLAKGREGHSQRRTGAHLGILLLPNHRRQAKRLNDTMEVVHKQTVMKLVAVRVSLLGFDISQTHFGLTPHGECEAGTYEI